MHKTRNLFTAKTAKKRLRVFDFVLFLCASCYRIFILQQSPVLFLLFLDLFAGEVFNGDLVKLHSLDVQRNFLSTSSLPG